MSATEVITYEFVFENGERRTITVQLEPPSYDLRPDPPPRKPDWTELNFERCPNCSLATEERWCPVALNLEPLNNVFSSRISYEMVDVSVHTQERAYSKKCPLQEAVGSLMGLIMATSGCPHLDIMRPMVITHLPFSTAEQTTYRMVSMYLLAQFLRQRRGLSPDWNLNDLTRCFEEIRIVNKAFARRLRGSQTRDANLNAIVRLDTQADLANFSIAEEQWEQLEEVFKPYLDIPAALHESP